MEVKPKTLETKKITTKVEEEMKTNNDDVMTTNGDQEIAIIKGHLKIIEGLRQGKTRNDQSSPKSSRSSSSCVMKIKMGNYKSSIPISENTQKVENLEKNKKVMMMNLKQSTEESNSFHKMKKRVWDCESTLYDSFELNSFNRQLDSAIASSARSMSMPHFPPPPSKSTSSSSLTKKQSSNRISRSLQKLIKSMFRHKQTNTPLKTRNHGVDMDKYYVVFDKTGSLTTIPESRESTELVGSEISSLVRKTVSERFPPSRLDGIFCS